MSTSKLERVKRRRKVAKYHLRGLSLREIAEQDDIDVSYQTVRRDLQKIHDDWKDELLEDHEKHVARELARINRVEDACWDLYEKMMDGLTTTTRKVKAIAAQQEEYSVGSDGSLQRDRSTGDPEPLEINRTKKERETINVGVIRRIQKCIDQRMALLGLDEYDSSSESGKLDALVGVIEQTADDTDLSQFEDEDIR